MKLEIGSADQRRRLPRRLSEMVRLSGSSEPRREALALNALEEVLLWCDSINPARAEFRIDPRVRQVMDHLAEHSSEPFSEDRLAHAAGLSGSRLRHLFRAQTGLAPRAFQEEKRMERARLLLAQSTQSIAEISQELGFENPFYFSLRFKKHSGQSPRDFRNRALKNA
jgi:AraC family transcriptional regulator of arabinose operon